MKFIWDNTYMTRDERTRIIILVSIFLILCILKYYTVVFYQPTSIPIDKHILDSVEMVSIKKKENYYAKKEFDSSKKSGKSWKKTKNKKGKKPTKSKPKPFVNFRFNPNTINKDSLLMLGFPSYAANSLIKYRSLGGVIRSIDQMSKINGLNKTILDRLTPYVDLPQEASKKYTYNKDSTTYASKKKKYKRKEPRVFDINTGDTTDFMNLHGIGRVYSKRIINYRKSLGGFFSIEQISDVWGIKDSLFLSIKPYLTVSPANIQKRNINNMDKDSLNKHPYINWQKSKTILSYKSAHGDYKHIDDLYKLHLLQKEFVDTMKLYFVVQ